MVERTAQWGTSLLGLKRALGALAVVAGGFFSAGCGAYEPEPAYPQYVAPPPATAAEIAAQQQAREQATAESREILIGADDSSDEYSDTDPSALTEFKPALDDHGAWVEDASYGTVWVPAKEEVGTDFQPYVSAGHWTYSDATDYVWVSDYSWGWAPFHYGRWVLLPGHGWAWIPGRRYAGAWVTWRVGPAGYGYVGWAPAPPSWYWYRGAAYGWSFGWYDYHNHYVYCPHNHVYHQTVSTYVVRGPAAQEHNGRTHDYVPARPGVGGDRVVANPSVGGGDRVVANPSVGGSDRVIANPGVGGHRLANPGVRGPRPDELGLKNDAIVAPPSSDQGLGRAQALALPSTAMPAGAAPPAHMRQASVVSSPANRMPASNGFVPGGSRSMVTRSQPMIGANGASTPPSAYRAIPNNTPGPNPPAAAYRSSPSFTTPSPASPSFRSSSPAVRSTPSFGSSSPSFRSSSPAVRSTPSFGSSSPAARSSSPSFRASSPAVRSSPSFSSSSRPSTPSRSSAPAVRSSSGAIRKR